MKDIGMKDLNIYIDIRKRTLVDNIEQMTEDQTVYNECRRVTHGRKKV